jgi:hypothetical protein
MPSSLFILLQLFFFFSFLFCSTVKGRGTSLDAARPIDAQAASADDAADAAVGEVLLRNATPHHHHQILQTTLRIWPQMDKSFPVRR